MKPTKQIRIYSTLHRALKSRAAGHGVTITELVSSIVQEHLGLGGYTKGFKVRDLINTELDEQDFNSKKLQKISE
jgi:hypothetical protein